MKLLDFPLIRQTYDYDCGPAAVQAVLVYYGIEVREDSLIEATGATPADGTPIEHLQSTLQGFGLTVESRPMTLGDLRSFIDHGIPVILALQAWCESGNRPGTMTDWANTWDDGHYATVIGYDDEQFYFADPSSFTVAYLPNPELELRWHDVDAAGRKYLQHGIAVSGKTPAYSSKNFVHLD